MSLLFDSLVNLSVGKLIKASVIRYEDIELYRFSMEVLLLKAIHFISYFIISIILHKVIACIVIITIFYGFRRNIGGYHAKTRFGCYLFSCFSIFASLYLVDIYVFPVIQVFIALCALSILILLPPVHNNNRTVNIDEEKYFRHRLRLFAKIFSLIYCTLVILNMWKYVWICTISLVLTVLLAILGKLQNLRNKYFIKRA